MLVSGSATATATTLPLADLACRQAISKNPEYVFVHF